MHGDTISNSWKRWTHVLIPNWREILPSSWAICIDNLGYLNLLRGHDDARKDLDAAYAFLNASTRSKLFPRDILTWLVA